MLKDVQIGTKLTVGFLLIALLGAITGTTGILMVNRVDHAADVIYEQEYPVVVLASQLQLARELELHYLHAILAGKADERENLLASGTQFASAVVALPDHYVNGEERTRIEALRREQEQFHAQALRSADAQVKALEALEQSTQALRQADTAGQALLSKMKENNAAVDQMQQVWAAQTAMRDYLIRKGMPEAKEQHRLILRAMVQWPDYGSFRGEHGQWVERMDTVMTAYDRHLAELQLQDAAMERAEVIGESLDRGIAVFAGDANENMAAAMKLADSTQAISTILLIAVAACGLVAAAVIGLTISRSITSRLTRLVEDSRSIGEGDLRREVAGADDGDELGGLARSFKEMVGSLRSQTAEMMDGVNVLASAASEISVTVTQLASSAIETVSAVSETTATIEQVKQTSQVATHKAKMVSDSARQTVQVSQAGDKAAHLTREEIDRIRRQMELVAESIVKLSEQSQTIGEIITSVDDLSEQSNLLAVNAAIEAAKAGEQGRGFAVVAQEIRSLAEQSKQATGRVRTILGDIQKATGAAVMATEQGSKAVEAGVKQAREAGDSIRVLTNSVAEAAQAAAQISASTQQQYAGVDQVTSAMENIRQASAQNVESTRQLELSATNLRELGGRLKQMASRYKV